MKKLVLAEKPSVGRDIARVIGAKQKINGGLEGPQYIVTWALGHLVSLADPEAYDKKYQKWELQHLPILPEKPKFVVLSETRKQYYAVESLLKRKDVGEVIIATDAGREGELVARLILEKSGVKKPIQRLWISSVTDKAIRDGFKNLKPGNAYLPLYASALARSEADWYVGINATRALTTKYNAQLSCGRVQTPTLALIAMRDETIRSFQPKPYYQMKAQAFGLSMNWHPQNQTVAFDLGAVEMLAKQLEQDKITIVEAKIKESTIGQPQLFDLTELQRQANTRFGYSAKQTLTALQSLYEFHKLVTYPRTDSRYLSSDIVPTLKERLEALSGANNRKLAATITRAGIKAESHFVNNAKVSDHHAIIPTEVSSDGASLGNIEQNIYNMIVARFLAVLLPKARIAKTEIIAHCHNEVFKTSTTATLSQGWYEAEKPDAIDKAQIDLNLLKTGQTEQAKISLERTQTKPPAHFTEATLLGAMENPSKYVTNSKESAILKETGGLGTVATRADIIEKLFSQYVIEKHDQAIKITNKGKQLLELVPKDLKSPSLTAKWEMELASIASGKKKSQPFTAEVKTYAKKIISEIKTDDTTFKHDNMTSKKCDLCGKPMLEVNGKKGEMLICSDPQCKGKKRLSTVTNARCPQCHKKLKLVGEGEKQMFVCLCGYREKMTTFEKRKKSETKKATKQDVNQFLRKQEKDTTSSFSALSQLLDD
ncbi:MAG: DNA topoisomerase III [Culicoidibacterales bacterium]